MKTLEQIRSFKKTALDGRDIGRLAQFLSEEDLNAMGVTLSEDYRGKHNPLEFTEENVMLQLKQDLQFAFRKALDQRGISSALMFDVIRMWNWVLDNELQDWSEDQYANYGLPLFKATALLYGFENPIGDDTGEEEKYEN